MVAAWPETALRYVPLGQHLGEKICALLAAAAAVASPELSKA